eukprot:CAMPEP_0174832582 /NCGR_PEP_ID=MMETSP1114-20130205/3750_1 /TAXON_ID=312471 /ORGANISM="Neobodo designis, Strain CCAP 1951/1" /LENGTH=682 /DNA_ID=CAMNT_0016066443 /DNA_START=44 /DNA_END=2092 /DNA_ORIENTATION=-
MSLPPHVTPRKVPYFRLQIAQAFAALTKTERLYAHHLNTACWHGASMCAAQVSAESPAILKLFFTLFSNNSVAQLREATAGKVEQDDFDRFVEYAALFYANLGNYKSFGDSKFIPACTPDVFSAIVAAAPNATADVASQYEGVAKAIYSHEEGELALGFEPKGRTSYYSPGITKEEVEKVDEYLKAQRIEQWNTRVWKVADKHFEVRIPCATVRRDEREHDGVRITLAYGDHAENFARMIESLEKALEFAANKEQKAMIAAYMKHFSSGSIDDHKQSQVEWVKDKGPAVETNMGFIETYRDPMGVRAEWEGFVAVVDKEQSKRYGELVARGVDFVAQLPWGKAFEKETFSHPDFTSLEVLGFASSGVPLGICIPNYDDIRQHGFKNVMLGNTVSAINFDDKMNHVTDADWALYKKHFFNAVSINVGVHELLGHGTGKLLTENEDGTFNFDKGTIVNPLTGELVATWYKPGETWGSVFKDTANPYEECRAEAVALFLGLDREILKIFGRPGDDEAFETVHVMWLNMIRGGLIGLEHYTPATQKWSQAHVRARYCILQTLLRCENPLVKITHDASKDLLEIEIDAKRIATDGKAAIGELLRHLNINKATANVAAGKAYFDNLTAVDAEFLAIRDTVLKLRKPRKEFVQAHTRLTADGDAEVVDFDPSPAGVVDSLVTRHREIPL